MKSYTDINQSKKLAEILPLESADMSYSFNFNSETHESSTVPYKDWIVPKYAQPDNGFGQVIPCWSLAALLNYIKDKCGYFHVYISSTFDGMANKLKNVNRLSTDIYDVYENELVDACYEMILKLNERKVL